MHTKKRDGMNSVTVLCRSLKFSFVLVIWASAILNGYWKQSAIILEQGMHGTSSRSAWVFVGRTGDKQNGIAQSRHFVADQLNHVENTHDYHLLMVVDPVPWRGDDYTVNGEASEIIDRKYPVIGPLLFFSVCCYFGWQRSTWNCSHCYLNWIDAIKEAIESAFLQL